MGCVHDMGLVLRFITPYAEMQCVHICIFYPIQFQCLYCLAVPHILKEIMFPRAESRDTIRNHSSMYSNGIT